MIADVLPAGVLESPAIRDAGARRDIGEIFRLAHCDAGLSISRMARLCDMTPSRVSAYVRGAAQARDQRVIERVADGLRIPGEILGLRSRPRECPQNPSAPSAPRIAQELLFPGKVATGVEVEFGPDSRMSVTYRQTVVNTTGRPISRLPQQRTFPEGKGALTLVALPGPVQSFTIEDRYDAGTFATFTCRMTTSIRAGDVAVVAYRCNSPRYVRRNTASNAAAEEAGRW
ncbi:helix-turn-helix transcriptional regulator [Streptomycetaceae bacterium NBC_01309]